MVVGFLVVFYVRIIFRGQEVLLGYDILEIMELIFFDFLFGLGIVIIIIF